MDKRELANELWPFLRAKFDPGSGASAPIALVSPGSGGASKAFAYSGLGLSNTDDGTTYTLILTSTSNAVAASILASNAAGGIQLARLGIGVADSVAAPLQVASSSTPQVQLIYGGGTFANITVGSAGEFSLSNSGAVLPNAHIYLLPGGNVGVGFNTAPAAELQVRSITEQLRLDYSAGVYASHIISSAGNYTIASTGGNLYTTNHLAHPNYVSQLLNWRISSAGEADFRYIYTDELHAKAFIADLEQALAGGQWIGKSVAPLYATITLPAAGGTANMDVEEFAGFAAFHVFVDGDLVRLRQFDRSGGGLKIADAWGTVVYSAQVAGSNPPAQRYVFTRHATYPGTASSTISSKVLVLDYGVSGNGYLEQNAIDGLAGANSPYYQIVTWNTHPKSVVAGQGLQLRLRMGNLRGLTGATQYGLYVGTGWTANPQESNVNQYSVTTPAVNDQHRYIIAGDNGVQIYNADLTVYSSTTPVISLSRTAPSIAVGAGSDTMTFSTGPAGFWVGNDSGTYKLRLGTVSGGTLTSGLSWDGSLLRIVGSAYIGNGVGFSTTALLYAQLDSTPSGSVINFNGHLGQVGTLTGTLATQTGKYSPQSIHIYSGCYLTYPAANNIYAQTGTISFWMWPFWDGNDATNRDMFFCGSGYFAAGAIRISRTPAQDGSNLIRFLIGDSAGGTKTADYATPTASFVNTWMHLAFTWDSVTGTMRMYRNGQLVASRLGASWTPGTLSANIETVRTYAGDHGIQDFAIIGRALTIDEVQSIYLSNAPLNVRQSNYELVLADSSSAGLVRGNNRGLFGYSVASAGSGTGAFALATTNGTSFDGQTMNAGDFMLGSVSSGLANLFFDQAAGRLMIRMGSVERMVMNSTGAFGIKDSSGANNVLLFSSTAGNQILQRVDLYGTGSITAGTTFDDIIFDSSGLTLKAVAVYADINSIKWKYSGAISSRMHNIIDTSGLTSTFNIQATAPSAGYIGIAQMTAYNTTQANATFGLSAQTNGFAYLRFNNAATYALYADDTVMSIFALSPSHGNGVKVIFIANASTVPTTNPTGGGVLYVTAGALKFRGSGGTVTPIAPA